MTDGNVSSVPSNDLASRLDLVREFEGVARSVLGDDPGAAGFSVTGSAFSIAKMSLRPRIHPEGFLIAEHFFSGHICGVCGAPGKSRGQSFQATVYDLHDLERDCDS